MLKQLTVLLIPLNLGLAGYGQNKTTHKPSAPHYTIAFASFAPLNTDIFVADADGSNPKPLLAHRDLDYNASFSRDGKWIIFTSERQASADLYRVHPDGSRLERLTDDPAFDDQGADVRRLTDDQYEEATPSWLPLPQKQRKGKERSPADL